MKKLDQIFLALLCCSIAFVAVGCAKKSTAAPAFLNDTVVISPDTTNPSNVLVSVTFLNPQRTDEPNVLINYDTLMLQRPVAGGVTNTMIPLSLGPTNGTSICSFSLQRADITNYTVYLGGCDNKPVGEAHVAREIKLGDPNQ